LIPENQTVYCIPVPVPVMVAEIEYIKLALIKIEEYALIDKFSNRD
jgi:hypothetical protein